MQGQGHNPGQQGLGVPQQSQQGLKKKTSTAQLADINDRLHWPEFAGLKAPFVIRYDDIVERYNQLQPNAINGVFDNCLPTSSGNLRQALRNDIDKLQRDVQMKSDSARQRHAAYDAYSIRSGWTGDLSAPSLGTVDSQHYSGQAGQGSSVVTTPTLPQYMPANMLGSFSYVATHKGRIVQQGQQDVTADVYVDAGRNAAYYTSQGWCGLIRTA